MLRTFSFSLSGESKTWLNELNEGIITSWNEMRESFISQYFSPLKFKRLLNEIHSFHQLAHETLVEAWIRLKEMLCICYGHGLTKGTIVHIFYHGLDGLTQGILDAEGIFLYNTPNEAFQILEDKVLLKLDFSGEFQISPKTVVSAGGSNIDSYHAMLMEKFQDLATKIDSKFLSIRKELKEMRDGRRDNYASQIYIKDDTPMCEPHEANYVQRYHRGYHDHEPINSYSYPNHNSHPSRYFEFTKTSTEEMMREWMASQTEANERMKNQGDVKFIKEEETEPNPTKPNPNLIMSNSPTVSPFLKDCTMHIPYTQEKVFEHDEISNHVGDKELISFVGIENELSKRNIKDTENPKRPNVSPSLVEYIPKISYPQSLKREISHLNRIVKES
ncbi:reverse transcriptase domain-containing protein [Tanacetum coccineum]